MNTEFLKRFIFMLIGNIILGSSIGFFRIVNLGTDPFTLMAIGISETFNILFGNVQLGICFLMFIAMFIFRKKDIGIGTFPSIVINGYIADFVYHSLQNTIFDTPDMISRLLILSIALLFCAFGVALYMETNLGIAPYDALSIIIEDLTNSKIPFKFARMITDSFCLVAGLLLGGVVGINTLIMALFTGILVNYFRNIIKKVRIRNVVAVASC